MHISLHDLSSRATSCAVKVTQNIGLSFLYMICTRLVLVLVLVNWNNTTFLHCISFSRWRRQTSGCVRCAMQSSQWSKFTVRGLPLTVGNMCRHWTWWEERKRKESEWTQLSLLVCLQPPLAKTFVEATAHMRTHAHAHMHTHTHTL